MGAVIVDSKKENVLGTGWNRMPKGCEGKFSWARAVPIEEGKFFYGKHYFQVSKRMKVRPRAPSRN